MSSDTRKYVVQNRTTDIVKKYINAIIVDFGLCLPSRSNLTEEEWNRIESALIDFSKR